MKPQRRLNGKTSLLAVLAFSVFLFAAPAPEVYALCPDGSPSMCCPLNCCGVCGDGLCTGNEACTCPQDCGNVPCEDCNPPANPLNCEICQNGIVVPSLICGDNCCAGAENCEVCPGDCGPCGQNCPNGICDGDETCDTCPQDCGACGTTSTGTGTETGTGTGTSSTTTGTGGTATDTGTGGTETGETAATTTTGTGTTTSTTTGTADGGVAGGTGVGNGLPCTDNIFCLSGCCNFFGVCVAPTFCNYDPPDPSCSWCDGNCNGCETCTCINADGSTAQIEACGSGEAGSCSNQCRNQGFADGTIWCCYQNMTNTYGPECKDKPIGTTCTTNGQPGKCEKIEGANADDCFYMNCVSTCGNGDIDVDTGEECDGVNTGAATCAGMGYTAGTVMCSPDCRDIIYNCYTCGLDDCETAFGENATNCPEDCAPVAPPPPAGFCGDLIANGTEVCDGNDFKGASCGSLTPATPMGNLSCQANCTSISTAGCAAMPAGFCGDLIANGTEVCDGNDFKGASCGSLTPATPMGALSCQANCTSISTAGCMPMVGTATATGT